MNSSTFILPMQQTGFPFPQAAETAGLRTLLTIVVTIFATAAAFWFTRRNEKVKAPVVGYRWFWEPAWLLRMRFITNSFSMIDEGYRKYKDSLFIVRRCDTDIVVMSNKYIDEIRKLPESSISVIEAHIQNLVGEYSGVDIARDSDLHNRALLRELTPNIGLFIDPIKDELDLAIKVEMPQADDWVEVPIVDLLLSIIARVSARVFVGLPLCRDEEWLQLSKETTVNAFTTAMSLRMLPSFVHPLWPLIVRLVPAWYRLDKNHRAAQRLVVPIVEQHVRARNNGSVRREKISPMLSWMSDFATNEKEGSPDNLASRQIMLGLGSIHTIKNAVAHLIYDLCAHPEYIAEIREEIEEALLVSGKWDKPTLTKLRKLESLMTESQRMNPPQLLSFYHRTLKPVTLSDGTYLPAATQLAIPAASLLLDPTITTDPQKFDPLRSYRARLEPEESNLHQYAMTSKTHMHFGHGRHSCPGRTFAVNEIKLIVAALLLEFDWRQVEGAGRPRNIILDEFVYPEPGTNLVIKRRKWKDGIPRLNTPSA
ncbi:hypothetical protein MMC11_008336 [Xylographa trunciseda]|nr:hypothetical protein [Xylographa trunciseda]